MSKCENSPSQPSLMNGVLIEVSVNLEMKGFDIIKLFLEAGKLCGADAEEEEED